MRNLALLSFCLILISTGCQQEPTPTPSPNPTPASSMTAWETSLVGLWNLKRTESRLGLYLPGLGDSTISYENHYNYIYALLDLQSTSYISQQGVQMYDGVWGVGTGANNNIHWYGGSNNTISLEGSPNYWTVKYLTSDSMILDISGGSIRYFYKKSTTQPVQNNIESQLTGGTWTLVSSNGTPSSYPTYKTFFNNWYSYTTKGYYVKDSTYYNGSGSTSPGTFLVLFPSRPIPILYSSELSYCKITNLTATALTLEQMLSPSQNANVSTTYIYSR